MKKIALLLALCLCLTACGPLKKLQKGVFSSHVEESTTSTTSSATVTTEAVTPGDVPTDGTTTKDTTVETTTTSTTHAVTTTSHPISTTIITRPTAAATTTTKKAATTTIKRTTTTRITTTTIKKTTTTKTITTTTTAKPTADKPDGVHTAMELEVFRLLNEERQSKGLHPLTLNTAAHAAAEVRAQEASVHWSHTRPDGRLWYTILDEFGISYWTAGENLAMGYTTGEALHNGWKNSPGHYANMMHEDVTSVAIAVFYNEKGVPYATQLFLG